MNLIGNQVLTMLSRNWWLLLIRGLAAIVFGLLAFVYPRESLAALVLIFGAYALAEGVLSFWTAILGRHEDHWWVLLLEGLMGILVGTLTFVVPGLTALALLFYISAWAIVRGALQIVIAVRLRKEISGEWLLILGGLASAVFGIMLMARPGVGALAVLWLIGTYALLFGVIMVMLAFRLRAHGRHAEAPKTAYA